jgi:glycosyltransferase involved in cell wall biosynthesis
MQYAITHNAQVRAGQALPQPQSISVMIGQLGGGGSERQLYLFLARCDRSRWSPVVYVSGRLGCWEAPICRLGIPVVQLRGSRLAKMLQFRSECIARDTGSFFSWSSHTNGFALALAGRGVHNVGSFRNANYADLPTRLRWLWSWLSLAGISTVVCNSRETTLEISNRSRSRRTVHFVPNAVEIFARERVHALREHWRARLGLSDDAVLVLGVGRLTPQKQFARFIDVIAQVRRQREVRAVIAGKDFGYLAELESQLARLGLQKEIRLLGEVSDARELICAADIFLLTSDYEGMPNVVLEAMAAEVPCVATRVNGVGDLIQHGTNGFIGERDVDDLAKHVIRLASDSDLRRAMGARARVAVERRYRPEDIMDKLWALCARRDVSTKEK